MDGLGEGFAGSSLGGPWGCWFQLPARGAHARLGLGELGGCLDALGYSEIIQGYVSPSGKEEAL